MCSSASCGPAANAAVDVEQTVDVGRRVDRARIDQFVVNARQVVCFLHDTHGALANVQCPKVAV